MDKSKCGIHHLEDVEMLCDDVARLIRARKRNRPGASVPPLPLVDTPISKGDDEDSPIADLEDLLYKLRSDLEYGAG